MDESAQSMNSEILERLTLRARQARRRVLELSTGGGCFTGSALSVVDILVYLYGRWLKVDPSNPDWPDRDYLILSKGHAVPALYSVLVEYGFFPEERLQHHLRPEDCIYWHPNRAVPGVDFHSGSLGHGLGVGLGIALDQKMCGLASRCVVILGDGELNEGSVWEAAAVAAAKGAGNLLAIVDCNRLQANLATRELLPMEPIEEKFRVFGWDALRADGHDFHALHGALSKLGRDPSKPTALIAQTVRGKGVAPIENRVDKWFCNFSEGELERMLLSLDRRGAEQTG